jgi:hypothetical protein
MPGGHLDSFTRTTGSLSLACIGDSLSTGFSVRSPLASVWAARFRRTQGWFDGTAPGLRSLASRLRETLPVNARSLATVSAHALPVVRSLISHRLFGTRHLAGQIDAVLAQPCLPDIVLMWIGHNDLDYVVGGHRDFQALAAGIAGAVWSQADRLCRNARFAAGPRLVVVFGLVGFARFFLARDRAADLRSANPHLYPHFNDGYAVFPSMLPASRAGMIETALMTNACLRARLDEVPPERGLVRLVYSDALFATDLSRADTLADSDAWHPSVHGHNLLAESAARELGVLLSTPPRLSNPSTP